MKKVIRNISFYAISFGSGFFLGSNIFGAFQVDKAAGYIVIAGCATVMGLTWILARFFSLDFGPKTQKRRMTIDQELIFSEGNELFRDKK